MMQKRHLVLEAVAIAAIALATVPLLMICLGSLPRLGQNFDQTDSLLDQTVTLTSLSYEKEFRLSLTQGDKLFVKVSVTREPIDFQVSRDQPFLTIMDETDILSFQEHLVIPSSGTYVFHVGTMGDNSAVHLTVTKD